MTDPDTRATAQPLLPAEDMPVGQEIDCGSHHVTETEMVAFASAWDPQYFHVDGELAAASDFGGLIASGLYTASVFQRLAVTGLFHRYDVVAGKEIRSLRFLRPVRAGDVVTCSITVRSVAAEAGGRCLVSMAGELRNQHGRPVLELQVETLVRSRQQA